MKSLRRMIAAVILFLPFAAASAQDSSQPVEKPTPDQVQALKLAADKALAAADATDGKDCTKMCIDAARKLAEVADAYFTSGDVQSALAAMNDAGRLAEKAGQASIDTKKRRKDTEIDLRKLQKRIFDIEQTLNFDDRPQVHQIVNRINKTRSDILMSMFDMPKKELGPEKKENQ